MKRTNIALFMLAAVLAIAQLVNGQTITQDTAYYRNGAIMQLNTYSNNVRVERVVFYPTGELQLYQEFDPVTGLQTGDEFWWFRNGVLEHSSDWVNGYAHGWAFSWDEQGEVLSSQVYVQSVLVPTADYSKHFPSNEAAGESDPSTRFAVRR